jgi:probable addiction module antidote protein
MKASVPYEPFLWRRLEQDPQLAIEFLNDCWEDGDDGVFLLALSDVANARGGLRHLAKKTGLNREHLFRMLSNGGNPTLSSLRPLLKALGLKLVFENAPGGSGQQRKDARHRESAKVPHRKRRGLKLVRPVRRRDRDHRHSGAAR